MLVQSLSRPAHPSLSVEQSGGTRKNANGTETISGTESLASSIGGSEIGCAPSFAIY